MFTLSRKLRVRHKLMIVCTLLALPGLILSVVWGRNIVSNLYTSQSELLGVRYAAAATALMTPIAKHRGLMASVILHDAQAAETETQLQQLETQTDTAFNVLQALVKENDALQLSDATTQLRSHWDSVRQNARAMSTADSFAAHTELLQQIIKFTETVAERSELILDPESLTYALMEASILRLPPTALAMGNVRGLANTYGRQATRSLNDQIRLAKEIAVLNYKLDQLATSTARAARIGGAQYAKLSTELASANARAEALENSANTQLILQTEPPQPSSLFTLGSNAYDGIVDLHEALNAALSSQLESRVGTLQTHLVVIFSIVAVLVCMSLMLVLKLCKGITVGVSKISKSIDELASGCLGVIKPMPGYGEFSHLMNKLVSLDDRLQQVITQVQQSASTVRRAAEETSLGSDDLSQRTQHQAAALEETAASIEQLTATVKQNTDHASQASRIATEASSRADQGGELINKTITSVTEISEASHRIADIISVIDGIAFQTNLLALNAAVEAARAGEHGRGFAVVAGEVRTLAQRSANAASEIRNIISDSTNKVETGVSLVKISGKTLAEIMAAVREVTTLLSGIATATGEQSQGIEDINKAVSAMDANTQQNAALVEQSSAASRVMAGEAAELEAATKFFTLSGAPEIAPVIPTPMQFSHFDRSDTSLAA